MKTALIIHGHFYQPPRENPFIGIVPDQKSAAPYFNWNDAVYRTCYRPNAYSRYLSKDGKINKICNNYSSISFNFGPSLYKWLKTEHTFFPNKIKEADRESIRKFGHSNILAQAFSHTILPLDSPIVRQLDIKWAIDDYTNSFDHRPEGFWCPECAINKDVIDDLVHFGIKFVILSPWQAASINNVSLNGKPAPCDRAFIVKGKKEKITVFFYDPDYASGISFGHLLTDADALYSKLLFDKKEKGNPKLINWATDGEIYGHHEAFGDMALAALIEKVNSGDEFELTNYASFLEKNPPKEEAQLWYGEDGKGSSWSCCHGVGRWERNCGCHTGGPDSWNQEWRKPLRNAFENLQKKVFLTIKEQFGQMLGKDCNYQSILLEYGKVLSEEVELPVFLSNLTDNKDYQKNIAKLLEIAKNSVNMFTSCGWFFNDIGGIEPTQNIGYSLYVSKILSEFTKQDERKKLLSSLSKAKSNLPEVGTGKDIALKELSKTPAPILAAAFFIFNRHFALKEDFQSVVGFFKLKNISDTKISIIKTTTFVEFEFNYSCSFDEKHKYQVLLNSPEFSKEYKITTSQASDRVLRTISGWIEKKLGLSISPETFRELLHNMDEYIQITNDNKNALNETVFFGNIGLCVRALQGQIMNDDSLTLDDRLTALKQISGIVKTWGSDGTYDLLMYQINNQLKYLARKISNEGLNKEHSTILINLLKTVRFSGLNPEITLLQDVLYKYLTGEIKTDIDRETLNELSSQLNFSFRF